MRSCLSDVIDQSYRLDARSCQASRILYSQYNYGGRHQKSWTALKYLALLAFLILLYNYIYLTIILYIITYILINSLNEVV